MNALFKQVLDTRYHWMPVVKRAVVRTVKLVALGIGLFTVAAVVLWDADFYVVRDRWENFKQVMFGDWNQIKACETIEGSDNRDCVLSNLVNTAIEDKRDFHLFISEPLPGTRYLITTGYQFTTPADLIGDEPSLTWCYLEDPESPIRRIVDLVEQNNDGVLIAKDDGTLALNPLAEMQLSVKQLRLAMVRHCQFYKDQPPQEKANEL